MPTRRQEHNPAKRNVEDLWRLVDHALALKKRGQNTAALRIYDDVGTQLMEEATAHARSNGGVVDNRDTRTIQPQHLELIRHFLQRDELMSTVSNNVAIIFYERGHLDLAKSYLEDAIAFLPEGADASEITANLALVHEARGDAFSGLAILTKSGGASIAPLIEAILHPEVDSVAALKTLSTVQMVDAINEFTDEVVLGLAMRRPEDGERIGFVLNPRAFESTEQYAAVMNGLLSRLKEAMSSVKEWGRLVGTFRPQSQ